ncbi:MAG: hypothetical protein JO322_03145 [Candidatus Eremiobacteraeota bacterium]|nr:hypothetical protein [Candidatus Eremiobacteraeota bacterium]
MPTRTAPPEIYHTVVHPVCSALSTKIRPAIGMLLENDQLIGKSPAMFKEYGMAQFNQSDAQKNMTILHMEDLVTPLADNVLAIQKMLEDPSVFPPAARDQEDQRTLNLKNQLLESLADQQAALDIINGFVETQQLADMQHEGFGYIYAISGEGQNRNTGGVDPLHNIAPTADPLHPQPFDDTVINAGLPTNPYEIDLTRVPGLTLGYNPVKSLQEGVEWTQSEGQKHEATLAKSVVQTVRLCGGQVPAPGASPSAKP